MDDESDGTTSPTRRQGAIDPAKLAEKTKARVESLPEEIAHRFPTIRADAVQSVRTIKTERIAKDPTARPPAREATAKDPTGDETAQMPVGGLREQTSPVNAPSVDETTELTSHQDETKTIRTPSIPSFPAIKVPAVGEESPPSQLDVPPDDESTTLLDREELLRNTHLDRKTLTPGMGTVEPVRVRDEEDEQTAEYKVLAESTRELNLIDDGFTTEDGQIGFAARINANGDITMSPKIRARAGLKPGDLVLVSIRKVDG